MKRSVSREQYKRFANLSFEDFKRMAQDDSLSGYEKIGFPDSYRKGKEKFIFRDIVGKLPSLLGKKKVVLDIGPGCSELPTMLIDLCRRNHHTLILVDSEEMLSRLPGERFVRKVAGFYPYCEGLLKRYRRKIDVILTYSVAHYVFVESNHWDFLDTSLELLSDRGQMLIGYSQCLQEQTIFQQRCGHQIPSGIYWNEGNSRGQIQYRRTPSHRRRSRSCVAGKGEKCRACCLCASPKRGPADG